MKLIDILRFVRYSVIVLLLVVITAFMIYAQPNANGNARGNDRTTETRTVERDDSFDWGWLGLLGLLGLAGLIPKRRKVEVQEFHDANQTRSTTR